MKNSLQQKNKKTALTVGMAAAGMLCLAYASVPLYNLFCKVTGYGGTTRVADAAPETQGTRPLTIRFNADISPDLDWKFYPRDLAVSTVSGKQMLTSYKAENNSGTPVEGMATYNVTPEKAAKYFNKIQCFCFERQMLQPYQKVDMPVLFFVDPAFEADPDMRDVQTITLSYTFFAAKK